MGKRKKKITNNQFLENRKRVSEQVRSHPEISSKIMDIEKKQQEKENLHTQLNDLFIKFKVKKGISKEEYETERAKITDNYEAIDNEIDEDLEELLRSH